MNVDCNLPVIGFVQASTMVSILHVDLISCWYLIFCTSVHVVASTACTYDRHSAAWHNFLVVCAFQADRKWLVSKTHTAFAENDGLTNLKTENVQRNAD